MQPTFCCHIHRNENFMLCIHGQSVQSAFTVRQASNLLVYTFADHSSERQITTLVHLDHLRCVASEIFVHVRIVERVHSPAGSATVRSKDGPVNLKRNKPFESMLTQRTKFAQQVTGPAGYDDWVLSSLDYYRLECVRPASIDGTC